MTVEELLAELARIAEEHDDDWEATHIDADIALLRFVDDERVTSAHRRLARWYA